MSRIPEPNLPPSEVPTSVQEFAAGVAAILNQGSYAPFYQETVPTDVPDTDAFRLVKFGGVFYWYAFFKTDGLWKRTVMS